MIDFCFYLFGRWKEPVLALPHTSTCLLCAVLDAARPPSMEGWGKRTINQHQTKMHFFFFKKKKKLNILKVKN